MSDRETKVYYEVKITKIVTSEPSSNITLGKAPYYNRSVILEVKQDNNPLKSIVGVLDE